MRTTILYFSGTGNTWYVASKLHDELQNLGIESTIQSIEQPVQEDILNTDHLIIGYPIYGSKAPRLMEEFINTLPDDDTLISTFSTVALYSGDGCNVYQSTLEEKGYTFKIGKEFIMNNNFNVPGFPDVLHVGNKSKIDKRHIKVLPKIKEMAQMIKDNQSKIQGQSIIPKTLGNIQRKHVDKYIEQVNDSLSVDHESCIHCEKCIRICPTDNIFEQNNFIQFNDQCMACMRCYHQCPVDAINITERSKDTNKWKRFRGVYKQFEKDIQKNHS